MSEAAAIPLPTPERPRRRRGQQPFVPTKEARNAVAIMAALGASEDVMLAILRRNDVPCRSAVTLRKHFHEELRQGREHLVTALGLKMVSWATGDGVHAFSACSFLLRTMGGGQWKLPRGEESDPLGGRGSEPAGRVVILPDNRRGDAKPEMFGKPPTTEARVEPVADETKQRPRPTGADEEAETEQQPTDDWTWRKVS
jgi:hypothetical protein